MAYWQHNKRGTRYDVLTHAVLQIDNKEYDMAPVVVYQDIDSPGKVWVRPADEFYDPKRFTYVNEEA